MMGYIISVTAIIMVLLLFAYGYYLNEYSIIGYDSAKSNIQKPTDDCGDSTKNFKCSITLPYFCENGQLQERASICGCNKDSEQKNEKCIYEYQNLPKNITLGYTIRGKHEKIKLTIYKKLEEYIKNLPKEIYSSGPDGSSRWDFKSRNINDPYQKNAIKELVIKIQNLAENKDDQARIAISLVQNIEYGASNNTVFFRESATGTTYSRYPYEVLYEKKGICGEKSELLAVLLEELGYGYALYYYETENHEAFAIMCPNEYSKEQNEYCFIETTGSSIITNDKNDYPNIGGELKSSPEIIYQKNGKTFGENNMYEYKDARNWIKIEKQLKEKQFINILNKRLRDSLVIKYGL